MTVPLEDGGGDRRVERRVASGDPSYGLDEVVAPHLLVAILDARLPDGSGIDVCR